MLEGYTHLKPAHFGPIADAIMLSAIVFHDVVYNPLRGDNEQESARVFAESITHHHTLDKASINAVKQLIMATQTHESFDKMSELLINLDLDILTRPFNKLIEFERQIFKEYQAYPLEDYVSGRVVALRTLQQRSELEPLIDYVKSYRPTIGIYPGSFNPFHKGHLNILQKAEAMFDKVIITRGHNPEKDGDFIQSWPAALEFYEKTTYGGLFVDYVKSLDQRANYVMIRGIRNGTDLSHEMMQYRYLRNQMPNLNVAFIPCDAEYEHISSSAIRFLSTFDAASDYTVE